MWITRSRAQLRFFLPLLQAAAGCFVFYSGGDDYAASPLVERTASALSSAVDLVRIVNASERLFVKSHRPKLPAVVSTLVLADALGWHSSSLTSVVPPPGDEVCTDGAESDDECTKPAAPAHLHDEAGALEVVRALRRCMPEGPSASWCVLYCGGVRAFEEEVKRSARRWGIGFGRESFVK